MSHALIKLHLEMDQVINQSSRFEESFLWFEQYGRESGAYEAHEER